MSRRLILTADDFGLDEAVNEAVERAHREGVLTATSLMVSAPAARDAIVRARHLPGLAVGLHVVLADGLPIQPLDKVASLVGPNGRFADSPARAGVQYFFDLRARREIAGEIRAQFEAFRATGLPLDHVNGHTHLHVHPTVLNLILTIGRDYGMRAMRLPVEPVGPGLSAHKVASIAAAPWFALTRHRLRSAGIKHNDFTYGLFDTGAMVEATVLRQIANLPAGIGEMYFHPATRRAPALDRTMPHYRHEEELQTLTSPKLRAALTAGDIKPIAFRDL